MKKQKFPRRKMHSQNKNDALLDKKPTIEETEAMAKYTRLATEELKQSNRDLAELIKLKKKEIEIYKEYSKGNISISELQRNSHTSDPLFNKVFKTDTPKILEAASRITNFNNRSTMHIILEKTSSEIQLIKQLLLKIKESMNDKKFDFFLLIYMSMQCYKRIKKNDIGFQSDISQCIPDGETQSELIISTREELKNLRARAYTYLTGESIDSEFKENAGNARLIELLNALKREHQLLINLFDKANPDLPPTVKPYFRSHLEYLMTIQPLFNEIVSVRPFCSISNKKSLTDLINLYNDIALIIRKTNKLYGSRKDINKLDLINTLNGITVYLFNNSGPSDLAMHDKEDILVFIKEFSQQRNNLTTPEIIKLIRDFAKKNPAFAKLFIQVMKNNPQFIEYIKKK